MKHTVFLCSLAWILGTAAVPLHGEDPVNEARLETTGPEAPALCKLAAGPDLPHPPLTLAEKPEQEPQSWSPCEARCPGSSQHGIPPYTMSCGAGQTCGGQVRDSNGEVCGVLCNGFLMACFPNGCA